jgi:hypothetical protein
MTRRRLGKIKLQSAKKTDCSRMAGEKSLFKVIIQAWNVARTIRRFAPLKFEINYGSRAFGRLV